MLSKNEMVKVRKAIESLYTGRCTILEYQKVQKANRSIGFEEVKIVENEPCKLSFEVISNANSNEVASALSQKIKLFISPEVKINPGSKIVIEQNNTIFEYKNSGEPAIYPTHQEIVLDLFKGWS